MSNSYIPVEDFPTSKYSPQITQIRQILKTALATDKGFQAGWFGRRHRRHGWFDWRDANRSDGRVDLAICAGGV
jgi:hypothetical protein